ncbi:MAG: XRE family transcriptional regulator [Leptospira sp.]|nr:XRE family transcriptional regulator [Leptospira sp.]
MKEKILGFRLKEARDLRNFTLSQVADRLGVTKQAISNYESGQSQPSSENVIKLINFFGLPIHFFSKEKIISGDEIGVVQFRKLASATRASREQGRIKAIWLSEIVQYLKKYVEFPKLSLPEINVDENLHHLTDKMIEEAARDARKFWNLGLGPISNVVNLLESSGIIVSRFKLNETLDAFSVSINKDDYIILGDSEYSARSRLNAGHELGHLLLHPYAKEDDIRDTKTHKIMEKQAFRFAGAFLLPAESFSKEFLSLNMEFLTQLKARWKVSIQAMVYRAGDLGLISEASKANFFRMYPGSRKKEPLDDSLPLEKPTLLKRSVELLVNEGEIRSEDLRDEFAYDIETLSELLGIEKNFFSSSDSKVINIALRRG